MTSRQSIWCGLVTLGVTIAVSSVCFAGELEDKGRAILEKNQKAVVTLQLVIKQKFSAPSMGSEEHESKAETTGVVIDPTGLTVLALSATDPTSMYENMMSAMDPEERFKVESNVGEVKITLDDGTELPASVVLRDKDLDLAFVRPVTPPAQPLAAVDFSQSATVQVLDPLVALGRLGKVASRTCCAGVERIQAIVRKPRTFYVPGNDPTFSSLGSPMFALDGKIVGLTVMRVIKGEGSGRPNFGGGSDDNMMAIVIPAADVLEAAKQAPEKAEAPAEQQSAPSEEKSTPAPKMDDKGKLPTPGEENKI